MARAPAKSPTGAQQDRRSSTSPALPYADVPLFMRELRTLTDARARALELAILCASRSGEVINARWAEFDVAARLWVIPASRMKVHKEHRQPLSDRCIEILESLPRDDALVFPGTKGKPLPRDILRHTLKRMGREDVTVHGFRSSFKDWGDGNNRLPNRTYRSGARARDTNLACHF
jgi:integrase